MISRRRSRILAVQALYAWEARGQVETPDLSRFEWHKHNDDLAIDADLHFFARHLLLGTIESIVEVDKLIKNQTKHWDFNRINKVDLAILRVSTYALQNQKDIPANVTIDEAVSIAKEFSSTDSYRFVNGVLDGIKTFLGK